MGVKIVVGECENLQIALIRFRRPLWDRHGVIAEMRRSRWFIKPTEIRRAKEYKKLCKASQATYLAKRAGEQ